jgi:integrase
MRHPGIERLMRGVVSRSGQAGMHAFRRGCNRRWELAGINPGGQMGHTSAAMTRLYTGEIPIEHLDVEFSSKISNRIVVSENMENEAAG